MSPKKTIKAAPEPAKESRGRKRGLKKVQWSSIEKDIASERTLEWYVQAKRELGEFHTFGFKTRKNFTPAQKSAITKKAKELGYIFRARKKGVDKKGRPLTISVVKVTKAEAEAFKGRYNKTNKGIIVFNKGKEFKILSVRDKRRRVLKRASKLRKDAGDRVRAEIESRVDDYMTESLANTLMMMHQAMEEREANRNYLEQEFGDLSDRRIIEQKATITGGKGKAIDYALFIPLQEGENITDLIDWVFLFLKPDQINIAMGRGISQTPYSLRDWLTYRAKIDSIEDKIISHQKAEGLKVENPIKGLRAIWRTNKIK